MSILYAFLIFILGLSFGSFLNVLILRYGSGYKAQKSKCLFCARALTYKELVPILSFVIQKGRCRSCRSKLSFQYPLVEFATAVFFVFLYFLNNKNIDISLLLLFSFAFISLAIATFDIKHKIVPSALQYALFALVLMLVLRGYVLVGAISFPEFAFYKLLSVFLFAAPYFLIWFISKGKAMGFADVKISAILGLLFYPYQIYSIVVLSFVVGALFSLLYISFRYLKGIKYENEIAFTPFILTASWLVYLFNLDLLMWYN